MRIFTHKQSGTIAYALYQRCATGGVPRCRFPSITRSSSFLSLPIGSYLYQSARSFASAAYAEQDGAHSSQQHQQGYSSSHRRQQHRGAASVSGLPIVNYYKRLEVTTEATTEEIKMAYRKKVLLCHPDVAVHPTAGHAEEATMRSASPSPMSKAEAEAAFRAVSEAYAVLSDPTQRAAHDATLGLRPLSQPRQPFSSPTNRSSATHSSSTSGYRYSSMQGSEGTRIMREEKRSNTINSKPSRTGPPSSFTSRSHRRRVSSSFVRGDADRIFREVFEGKGIDQVLFEARRRVQEEEGARRAFLFKRKNKTPTAENTATASPSEENRPPPPPHDDDDDAAAAAANRQEANVQMAMAVAAQRYASRLQKRYGRALTARVASSLRRRRRDPFSPPFLFPSGSSPAETPASSPPADGAESLGGGWYAASPSISSTLLGRRMPFRPFPGMRVPEGVEVPADPVMGPWTASDVVEASDPNTVITSTASRREARQMLELLASRTPHSSHQNDTVSGAAPSATAEINTMDPSASLTRTEAALSLTEEDEAAWEALCREEEGDAEAWAAQQRVSRSSKALEQFRKSPLSDPETQRKPDAYGGRDVYRIPYNMGQLYSYQRPY